jgi:glycosyltransferase involved in cell wall biosynthesis
MRWQINIIPAPTAHSMQLMKVCHALGQLGHQVELIVPGKRGIGWNLLADHYGLTKQFGIRYISSITWLKRYDFAFTSIRYARRQKPDLVYTWLLPAAVMAQSAGLPALLELHDRITGRVAPWLFSRFIKSKTPGRLAVITRALIQKLKTQFNDYKDSTDTVLAPNGVELDKYTGLPSTSAARKQLGLPDRLTVVYTGSFYAGRGIDLLYHLATRNPGIQFVWAGGTESVINEWKQKLEEEGCKNVHITGFINNRDLPMYQAAGDILVMPFGNVIAGSSGGNSVEICSPMKMFDYLAAGRVIMASDLPVLHEILNTRNAILLPPDDHEAWHQALHRLDASKQLRQKLGEQAHRDAGQYTWLKRQEAILKGFPD